MRVVGGALLIVAAAAVVGCAADQFTSGDAAMTDGSVEAAHDGSSTGDGNASDAGTDVIGPSCEYSGSAVVADCFGATCLGDCCVTSASALCMAACTLPNILLPCTRPVDCATQGGGVCCLEEIDLALSNTGACPRSYGGNMQSVCTPGPQCDDMNVDGGPRFLRMCVADTDCVGSGTSCQESTFALDGKVTFGICR
jgi:hypothetical protein